MSGDKAPSPFSTAIPKWQVAIQVAGHMLTPKRLVTFFNNFTIDGDCWTWKGPFVHNGYGQFNVGGRGGTNLRVHRIVWELHNGPIPVGIMVLHSCDNRKCGNPSHLRTGTARENTQEMVEKGRARNGAKTFWKPEYTIIALQLQKEGKSHRQIGLLLPMIFSHETVRVKLKEANQ